MWSMDALEMVELMREPVRYLRFLRCSPITIQGLPSSYLAEGNPAGGQQDVGIRGGGAENAQEDG